MVAFGTSGATTIDPPSGWTLIRRDDASTISQALYYHVANGSEPSSYTWTLGSAQLASGGISDYIGVDTSAPIDDNSGAADTTGSDAAPAAPAVTTTVANDMLVGFFSIDSVATFTPPAGMAEEWDTNSAGNSPSSESAQLLQASIGSSGTETATADAPGNWLAQLIALKADVTDPTGSITAPAPSANVAGSGVTVSSDSADATSGVASALFQSSPSGANTWTDIGVADTTNPYSVSWDTTAVTDGQYDLRVITTNNSSNAFTSAVVTVGVDNTLPTGSVTAPVAGATVWGKTVKVSSNSADVGGSGVASAQFQRSPAGAGTWTNIGLPDTTAPYSAIWNNTKRPAGNYDLQVTTVDKAGNTFTSAVVTVIVPPPLVFKIGKTKVTAKGTKSYLTESMKPSARVKISVTLHLGNKVAHRWRIAMKAGRHRTRLSMPKSRLKVGSYTLVATATSADTQSVRRTTKFRVNPKPKTPPQPKPKPTF